MKNNFFLLKCLHLFQSVPFPHVKVQHTAFPSPSVQRHGKKATQEFFSRLPVFWKAVSELSWRARAERSRSHYAQEEAEYLFYNSFQSAPNVDAVVSGKFCTPPLLRSLEHTVPLEGVSFKEPEYRLDFWTGSTLPGIFQGGDGQSAS